MKRADKIVIGLIIACGLTMAALKAATASLVSLEMPAISSFAEGGLQAFLSGLAAKAFGNSEFAIRYPSLLAYIAFAFAFAKLVEISITGRALRLVSCAAVMLHPYLIDTAALGSAHMLSISLNTICIYFTIAALSAHDKRGIQWKLILASCALGFSIGALTSATRVLPAVTLLLLLSWQGKARSGRAMRQVSCAVVPAAIIGLFFLIPRMASGHLPSGPGTAHPLASIQSLRLLSLYLPSSILDAAGNPLPNPQHLVLWNGQPPSIMQAIALSTPALIAVFALVGCIAALPFRCKLTRPAISVHSVMLTILAVMLIEGFFTGSYLPTGRSWLALTPFLAVTGFALLDHMTLRIKHESQKLAAGMICIIILTIMLLRIEGFSTTVYWEWPDSRVAPRIVSDLSISVSPGTDVSLGCPAYLQTPLRYYAEREGFSELSVVLRQSGTTSSFYIVREDLATEPLNEMFVVERYTNTFLVLTRDPGTPAGI